MFLFIRSGLKIENSHRTLRLSARQMKSGCASLKVAPPTTQFEDEVIKNLLIYYNNNNSDQNYSFECNLDAFGVNMTSIMTFDLTFFFNSSL